MNFASSLMRQNFISLARQEGMLALKGNKYKSGTQIEKYLSVFRNTLGERDSNYLDPNVGYDWCCAFVYYLLKQVEYNLETKPLLNSNWSLAAVKTWYEWSVQEKRVIDKDGNPEAGFLVLFSQLIEPVTLDHIGVVVENRENTIITAEGNYYNQAGIFERKKDHTIEGYINLW